MAGEGFLDFVQFLRRKAELAERFVIDVRGIVEAQGAHDVTENVVDLLGGVAEIHQGRAEGLVGDFEITPAREFLEFDEGKIGLDAGGIAIHQQADGSCRSDDGGLCVAEAVLFAQEQGAVPAFLRGAEEMRGGKGMIVGELGGVHADGLDVELLVFAEAFFGGSVVGNVVGGAAVIADDAQHVVPVFLVAGESAEFAGHFGAGGVAFARQNRRERGADGAAFFAVVGDAGLHEHGAEVGVAQAERAVAVALFGDFLGGEAGHEDADLQDDGPQADAVAIPFDVETASFGVEEGHHVERRQVARRVVEEHVFGAVVDGQSVGDEGLGNGLGEVEDLLTAQGGEGFDAVKILGGLRRRRIRRRRIDPGASCRA